jgi:hypothetical protein
MNGKYNADGSTDTVVFPVLGQPYVNREGIQAMSFVYCFNAKSGGDMTPIFNAVGIIPALEFVFKYSINSMVSFAILFRLECHEIVISRHINLLIQLELICYLTSKVPLRLRTCLWLAFHLL